MKKVSLMLLPLIASLALIGCNQVDSSSDVNDSSSNTSENSSSKEESSESSSSSEETSTDSSEDSSSEESSSSENNSSSEDNNSSDDTTTDGKITYLNALKVLDNALVKEALKESKVTSTDLTFANNIKTLKEETFNVYADGSSAASGTVTRTENNQEIGKTTYKSRNQRTVDKIFVDNRVVNYDMFVQVEDYENDSISNLKDKASKVYIVNSDTEAQQNGLNPGDYIVKEAYPIFASKHVSRDTKHFLAGNVVNNPDLGNAGSAYVDVTVDESGKYIYSDTIEYSYDGELNDLITETISFKFVLDENNEKMLSSELNLTKTDVAKDDPTDVYKSGNSFKATIEYDTKVNVPADAINVEDYFLANVNSVQMLALDKYSNYTPVESNKISLESSYIRAKAKEYTPAKAVMTDIRCIESTNSDVVLVSKDGYMEVKGVGTTTLTFNYSGKDNDVYKLKEIKEEITIVQPDVEDISILPTTGFENNTINVDDEVTLNTFVVPSKCNQALTAVSSNENVLKVTVKDGKVTIRGIANGTADLTLTSVQDPTVSKKVTVTVIGGVDFKALLISNNFVYDGSLYNYYLSISFNEDGTGVLKQLDTSKNLVEQFTFKYTLDKNKIAFSSWSENVPQRWAFNDGKIIIKSTKTYLDLTSWYESDMEEGGTSNWCGNFYKEAK